MKRLIRRIKKAPAPGTGVAEATANAATILAAQQVAPPIDPLTDLINKRRTTKLQIKGLINRKADLTKQIMRERRIARKKKRRA